MRTLINLPPYPACIALVVNDSKINAMKYFKKSFSLSGEIEIHDCAGISISADNNGHLIYIPKWKKSPKCYAILSHEALHVANRVLQQLGVKKLDWDNDEPIAYLQSYIVEQSLKRIK